MEGLSIAASAVAFMQAGDLALEASRLYKRFKHGDQDLESIRRHLDRIEELLHQVDSSFQEQKPANDHFKDLVREIDTRIRTIRDRMGNYGSPPRKRDRLRLAFDIDQFHKMQSTITELKDIIMAHKNITAHAMTLQRQDEILEAVRRLTPPEATSPHQPKLESRTRQDQIGSTPSSWSYTSPESLHRFLGIRLTAISKRRRGKKRLLLQWQFEPPLVRLSWMYSLAARSLISDCAISYVCSKVVEDNDPFLVACIQGDLYSVRRICHENDGVPDVMTSSDMTPLLLAVEKGHVELIRFLLDHGANVNRCGSPRRTSPLQWAVRNNHLDVVGVLMNRGADLDYVNSLGWNPLFYCWPKLRASWIDRTAIIKLIADRTFIEPDETDTLSWTPLQRAAAFGTEDDIKYMVKLWKERNGDLKWRSQPMGWEVIHYAVRAGNPVTFEVLLNLYGEEAKHVLDGKGWSLLHYAAERPCVEKAQGRHYDPMTIMRRLLETGSDPYLKTHPTWSDGLAGAAYTAEDIARMAGTVHHRAYLRLLDELGIPRTEPDGEFLGIERLYEEV